MHKKREPELHDEIIKHTAIKAVYIKRKSKALVLKTACYGTR